jgi:hypothetical protein
MEPSVPGELRVLQDQQGVFADILDALHVVAAQLRGFPYALVGGVAVLVHLQGYRVTQDIDSAVQGTRSEVRRRLLRVASTSATAPATVDKAPARSATRCGIESHADRPAVEPRRLHGENPDLTVGSVTVNGAIAGSTTPATASSRGVAVTPINVVGCGSSAPGCSRTVWS